MKYLHYQCISCHSPLSVHASKKRLLKDIEETNYPCFKCGCCEWTLTTASPADPDAIAVKKELTQWGDEMKPDPTTGAKKADGGKLRYDLYSPKALRGTVKILTFGAEKYGDRNWEAGFPWSRCYAALQRHLQAWWDGEDLDKESGESHLSHAACCLMFLQHFEHTYRDGDDRPK